mmetsp:Transcript_966/g.1207  ORF Transcript_966/g.1207 Transcript_966/m.1207 type:complete len:320 (+) Transcript_966:220-1179(+)
MFSCSSSCLIFLLLYTMYNLDSVFGSYNGNKVSTPEGSFSFSGDEDDTNDLKKKKNIHSSLIDRRSGDYFLCDTLIDDTNEPYAEELMHVYMLGKHLLSSHIWRSPFDKSLEIDTAAALLSWIRVSTHGNIPIIDTKCQKHNRLLWRNYSSLALQILKKIKKHQPHDSKVALLQLETSLYENIGKGSGLSIITGSTLQLQRLLVHCERCHETYAGGLVYALQVGFYMNAQWPFRNAHKALKAAVKALSIDPYSQRNRYLYGAVLLALNQPEDALKVFRSALDVGCTSDVENDLAPFLKGQIVRGIATCQEKIRTRRRGR